MDADLDLGSTIRGFSPGQKLFNRFTLAKILGRGGMGVVWLARDDELERDVALKFLPEIVALDRESVAELKRETRRNLDLTHPNIVRIYDFVQDARSAAISMEFINGTSLSAAKVDRPNGTFPMADIRRWAGQLCEALSYAHNRAKVVHRDLKPANLMIDTDGNLKITDFGIACSITDSVSRVSKNFGSSGTPIYMSPQQMMGDKPAPSDDIYSLGATLYEMVTGKPPFHTGNIILQVQNKVAPSMGERLQELGVEAEPIPAEWETVIAKCLAKNATDRPASVADIAAQLKLEGTFTRAAAVVVADPLPAAKPAPAAKTVAPVPAEPPAPKKPFPWLIVAAAVVVAAGLGVWLGDVPNRIKAAGREKDARIALIRSDWLQGLSLLREAASIRPTDPEHRRAYDEAQAKWLEMVRQEIEGKAPRAAYDILVGKTAVAVALADPHAQHFQKLIQTKTEEAKATVDAAIADAAELTKAEKFAEAFAALSAVRSHASLAPTFNDAERSVKIAEVQHGIGLAVTATEAKDFKNAYSRLEQVKTNSALVPEYEKTVMFVRESEVRHEIAAALEAANANEFADAFAALEATEKRGLLADEIGAARTRTRELAEAYNINRLGKAIVAGDTAVADAIIADYARFTQSKFEVTGRDLVEERDFAKFVAALQALRIRPAEGTPRTSWRDIILVATVRKRFTDTKAVNAYLADGYTAWSRKLEPETPALAIYVNELARKEGATADAKWEKAAINRLPAQANLAVGYRPVQAKTAAPALRDAPVKALTSSLNPIFADWTSAADSATKVLIELTVTGPESEDRPSTENKSARYQSGTRMVENMDYNRLQNSLRDAQQNLYSAQQSLQEAKRKAESDAAAQSDPNARLAMAFAGALVVTAAQKAVNDADSSVRELRNELAETPRMLEKAVYDDEPYKVITHRMTYSAALTAKLGLPSGASLDGSRWTASFSHETVEVVGNARRNVPVKDAQYPTSTAITDRLGELLSRNTAKSGEFAVKLADATVQAVSMRCAAEGAPDIETTEQLWSTALLWGISGVKPTSASAIETRVRRTLGLP